MTFLTGPSVPVKRYPSKGTPQKVNTLGFRGLPGFTIDSEP